MTTKFQNQSTLVTDKKATINQPPGSHGSEQELCVLESCNKHKIESTNMNAPSKPRNTKQERGRG